MPGAFAGYYLDGRSAARRPASVRLAASGLEIELADGARLWWSFRDIRQTQGFYAGEQIRLERGAPFPEALLVDDAAFLAALHATARGFGRRFHDPRRRRARLLLTIGAAVSAVAIGAVLYVWGIPAAAGVLAARVPVSWEERLGQAAVEEITASKRRCVDREREDAIGAIVQRLLEPQPRAPYTFRVIVVDDLTVNAFAVPGGQVVLLRGLVERARTPEELAGVLAHELQHVLQRHATRLLLQHASTGLLLVAVSGDITGAMTYGIESARVLGTLSYSRHLESEADVEGLRMLLAADVDPRGMIAFFDTMRAAERGAPSGTRYLASHPLAGDRVETLQRLAAAHTKAFRPLLPGRDWADLRRVCGS
ncbi:MAG: M48 family metallopeptidase [Candidatus Rokuibacteriota bacterium]